MADHVPEKEVYADPNTVHNEKMVSPGDEKLAIQDSDSGSGDAPRRQSVAGNIVHNPLQRLSKGAAAEQASAFAEGFGMPEHSSLFARAALVARDPERFEMLTELEQDERDALIYERDHKWHGPKMLWYSIGLCAIGAATQGWDQTGSNGANLSFHEEFNINGEGRDEWIVGVINAIIFLTAGLIGAFIVGKSHNSTFLSTCTNHLRPSQQVPRTSRRNLLHCHYPHCHPHRLSLCPVMARSLRRPLRHGHWHWCKERHRPHLLR